MLPEQDLGHKPSGSRDRYLRLTSPIRTSPKRDVASPPINGKPKHHGYDHDKDQDQDQEQDQDRGRSPGTTAMDLFNVPNMGSANAWKKVFADRQSRYNKLVQDVETASDTDSNSYLALSPTPKAAFEKVLPSTTYAESAFGGSDDFVLSGMYPLSINAFPRVELLTVLIIPNRYATL